MTCTLVSSITFPGFIWTLDSVNTFIWAVRLHCWGPLIVLWMCAVLFTPLHLFTFHHYVTIHTIPTSVSPTSLFTINLSLSHYVCYYSCIVPSHHQNDFHNSSLSHHCRRSPHYVIDLLPLYHHFLIITIPPTTMSPFQPLCTSPSQPFCHHLHYDQTCHPVVCTGISEGGRVYVIVGGGVGIVEIRERGVHFIFGKLTVTFLNFPKYTYVHLSPTPRVTGFPKISVVNI